MKTLNWPRMINVSKVLARAAADKARVKPLPRVSAVSVPPTGAEPVPPLGGKGGAELDPQPVPPKGGQGGGNIQELLIPLESEFAQIKRTRGKLSTQAAWLVIQLEEQLYKQSPAMADEFVKGNLAMPELVDHYAKIEELTQQGAALYDKIDYVKRYGHLPQEVEQKIELRIKADSGADAIKHQIRRLDDLIYKTDLKIKKSLGGIKAPKNSNRMSEWRVKLALADAERFNLKQKLKQIQYEARLENRTA